MVLAKSVERTMGKQGSGILKQAEEQVIRLEERGCGGKQFVKQADRLVKDVLVSYLSTPKGKNVHGQVCLVIPFGCRRPNRIMEMVGSGRPLMPQVDLDKVADAVGAPKDPYIIYDVRMEQTAFPAAGRRYLTFEELASWCVMNEPGPETAFLSLNSKAGGKYVGIEFDRNKNPRIVPFAELPEKALSCAKAIIA